MSSVVDLEAQQVAQAVPRVEVEGDETHELDTLGPHTSVAKSLRSASTGQDINDETRPAVPQSEVEGDAHETDIDQSRSSNDVRVDSNGDRSIQAEAQIPVASNPTFDPGPGDTTSDPESEEPRMIGDFDGTASEFWKLFTGEAKGNDDARINTLKEGMDSALIFAGLFSAVLTAFVVDSKQNLKPSPSDETVYYLRQQSAILSQISVQLSSIAPQVSIPATPPPPFPQFTPLASDLRVNIFWFMALAFSLLAALLAILVQQWVRNYMHVFQRYSDPLKSSRVRQYLYEGCERWNMPRVAEAVPGFLHISLFLFFAGLGDSLLNINTKVALSTLVPIGVSSLLYIFTTFAPIIYPQSPYQNSFSGIFWYLIQKLRGRRFRDRGSDGGMKPVSTNTAQGQMQLAMEETEARKDRDERAIRWLIDNLTEDAEMEKFLLTIPGSFNMDWGAEVWKKVGKHDEIEDQSQGQPVTRPHRDGAANQVSSFWTIHNVVRPIAHLLRKPTSRYSPTHATTHSPIPHSPDVHSHSTTAHMQRENVVHELSIRVARSVKICNADKDFSINNGLRRKRTHACIEVTASLIFCANAKLSWFGGISELLGDIGSFEKIRESSSGSADDFFVMRWTCLSLLAIRPSLEIYTTSPHSWETRMKEVFREGDETGNDGTLEAAAQKIDETIQKARGCLFRLYDALRNTEDLTDEVMEILRGHESEISELEQINIEADRLDPVDGMMFWMQNSINDHSHEILSQFPGVLDDFNINDDYNTPIPFNRLREQFHDPCRLLFMRPRQTLKCMCSPALTLRKILEGQEGADAYKGLSESKYFWSSWQGDEMQRQLWRLQDLWYGGGFGVSVELFFLALTRQLFVLATSPSKGSSHSALYMGTFQAITSDWSKYKHSPGTRNLLLTFATTHLTELHFYYPAFIVDEFFSLLSNICEGQTSPHIDKARQQLESSGLMVRL